LFDSRDQRTGIEPEQTEETELEEAASLTFRFLCYLLFKKLLFNALTRWRTSRPRSKKII
jgi:hypothetical protein